jgi:hypothetical protein
MSRQHQTLSSQNKNARTGSKTPMNPPSIPSHMSVFGYEENQTGQLVKQTNNQVGFTGVKKDTVGPGDYEIQNAQKVVGRAATGVVQWKKPTTAPKTAGTDNTRDTVKEMPGPGEYEINNGYKAPKQ